VSAKFHVLYPLLALTFFPLAAYGADKPKICFVYSGSRSDGGWSESHERGRLMVEKSLGDRVTTDFVENVAEGPASEPVIERLAAGGCNMIFATAFGYMDAVLKVASAHPNVKFEHATGYKTTRNVATFSARFYQARYLLGRIAAKTSKTGKAIYVATFPLPDVISGINAFELGARSVDPAFRTKVAWIDSWFDPEKEAKAVEDAISAGADIVTQQTDSTAPLQVAEARKIHGFGQSSDMLSVAPNAQLTAIVDNWGAYDVKRVEQLLEGTWTASANWEGLKSGIFQMAPYTNMTAEQVAFAKDSEKKLLSGKLVAFKGPVRKQNGKIWLKKGEKPGDSTLTSLDFLVEGVEGDLPKSH
jgi:basic membrane protein A and related proteins